MARLVGIILFLGVIFVTIDFAAANAPTAADNSRAEAAAIGRPPDNVLAFADPDPAPGPQQTVSPNEPSWLFGAYTVGESANPRVRRFDSDLRPKTPLLVEDDRLEGDLLPDYMRTIQGEIPPGLYSTDFTTAGCSYSLWRVMKPARDNRVIGEDFLTEGRMLVTINGIEPDWFVSTAPCGEWTEWKRRVDPSQPAANGDYWVGDLAPGHWDVPENCILEEVVGFRGASIDDVLAHGSGPGRILIGEDTLGLRVRGCQRPLTPLS